MVVKDPKLGDIIVKESSSHPQSMASLKREFDVITLLQNRELDFGLLKGQSPDFSKPGAKITLKRKGTNDLSDVGHDITVGEYMEILANLACQIQNIHNKGIVHRDIKPGNIMVTQNKKGAKKFAGIVDFGMAVRTNRRQFEPGVAGGTEYFAHPSQWDENKNAHVGQDWYGFVKTALYLLRTNPKSMDAEEKQYPGGIEIDYASMVGPVGQAVTLADLGKPISTDYVEKLGELVRVSTSVKSSLDEIKEMGEKLAKSARSFLESGSRKHFPNHTNKTRIVGQKITKHDLLLIVDETNSLQSEMENVKERLEEVLDQFDGLMDLRVDLWTVRDYRDQESGDIGHETVRKVGYRLIGKTLTFAIEDIAADADQLDQAEAYEMAF